MDTQEKMRYVMWYTRRYCCDIQLFKSVVIILFNDINFYNSCCQNSYLYFILIFSPQDDAEHICKVIRDASLEKTCKPSFTKCCCYGAPTFSFKKISTETGSTHGRTCNNDLHLDTGKKVIFLAGLVYIVMTQCKLPFSWFDIETPCL